MKMVVWLVRSDYEGYEYFVPLTIDIFSHGFICLGDYGIS